MTSLRGTFADVGVEGFAHAREAGTPPAAAPGRKPPSAPREITTQLDPADAVIGRAGRLAVAHLRSPS